MENVFQAVRGSVTARQAAERYGLRVNAAGMACCPFHSDRKPSMKLDRRFHCFGCQADGNVIDFTARLLGLTPVEAARRLAEDFSVPYEDRKPGGRRGTADRKKAAEAAAARQLGDDWDRAERHFYHVLVTCLKQLKKWREDLQPPAPAPGEEAPRLDDRLVEAMIRIPQVEWLVDRMCDGTFQERMEIMTMYAKEAAQLEKRLADADEPAA